MTRSPGCTVSPTGCPGLSTTPLSPRSSPPRRRARTSSTTPAPRKPSPSSPGTDHAPARRPRSPAGRRAIPYEPRPAAQAGHHRTIAVTRAAALRWWRAGYEAGRQAAEHEHQALAQWDRLVASFHAQRAADQQAKLDALLLEAIAALADLFSGPDHPGNRPA